MKDFDKRKMLKIGDIAKLNDISIDTLRYYDKIGLFTADWVDDNGYRYYWPKSMVNLDLIMSLRSNGASINMIKDVMNDKSLLLLQELFIKREDEILQQIERLTMQLQICKMYSGFMKLAENNQDNSSGYFLSYEKRWCMKTKESIAMEDKDEFELGLKTLFQHYPDKFKYYNAFFGGVFHKDGPSGFSPELHPAVFHFSEFDRMEMTEMEAGIYALLQVDGYFDTVYEKIPELMEFIERNNYHPCSDCYVVKLWEKSDNYSEEKELMEIQVRVERN